MGPPKTNEEGGTLKGELPRKGFWEGGNRREFGNLIGTPDKLSPPPSNPRSTHWLSSCGFLVCVGVTVGWGKGGFITVLSSKDFHLYRLISTGVGIFKLSSLRVL